MGRARTHTETSHAGPPGRSRPGTTVLVVAHPRDAGALISPELRGKPLVVVSLAPGGDADRQGLSDGLVRWVGGGPDRWRSFRADRGTGVRIPGERLVLDGAAPCEMWLLDTGAAPRDAVLDALVAVFGEVGPVLIRTQDPDPVHTRFDADGQPVVEEPAERGEAARRTVAAARRHQNESGHPVFVECARAGARMSPDHPDALRYPRPVNWLALGRDSRLSAYVPTAAGVVRWYEARPGDPQWHGPELLEGPALMPALTVVQSPDGYVRLMGLRRTKRQGGGVNLAVVHATQYQTGRALAGWHSLGNPNAAHWQKAREVGFPAAAVDADGALHVFVRNVGHSLSTRRQAADGKLSAWQHLGGERVADDVAAACGRDGSVEVYARAKRPGVGAVRRYCGGPDGEWQEEVPLPFAPLPGTLSVSTDGGWHRKPVVHFDGPQGGDHYVWQPADPEQGYTAGGLGFGASAGRGRTSTASGVVIDGWPCTVLARAGADGGLLVGAYPDGRPDAGVWWAPLGEGSLMPPAVTRDAHGRAVIAAIGADGRLRIARQGAGPGLRFGHLRPV